MTIRRTSILLTVAILGTGGAALTFGGCQTGQSTSFQTAPASLAVVQDTAGGDVELTGAELWDQTCSRCHNGRSPASYSDAKWKVVMRHMRTQANLDGETARKILEFLQAAN